jgi:hypothetical protein
LLTLNMNMIWMKDHQRIRRSKTVGGKQIKNTVRNFVKIVKGGFANPPFTIFTVFLDTNFIQLPIGSYVNFNIPLSQFR